MDDLERIVTVLLEGFHTPSIQPKHSSYACANTFCERWTFFLL
jgi:hypothetical protein